MRWLYVTPVRLTPGGGQSTRIAACCRALGRTRETILVAPAPLPGVAFIPAPLPARPPRELVFQARAAEAVLRAADPRTVVYVRAAALNLGVILAARRAGARCALELNGIPALEYGLERRRRDAPARRLYYHLLQQIEHRAADAVVGVTPQLAAEARRSGARRVFASRNGVDPRAFTPLERAAARRALTIPEDAEVVGFAGNFAAWQGCDTLVAGVAQLAAARPGLRLLLIGDGVERAKLEALAAPLGRRAVFLGRLPHGAVPAALSACDVLAAPLPLTERNRRTGVSPIKIFEYLALARPVLASRIPGMEPVANLRLGALFRPGDPASLAASLAGLLDLPPEERAAIGRRARAAAEDRFTWDRVVEEIVAFVES